MTVELPDRADVVIVGGGAMGTSSAFHLAEAGVRVVVIERDEIASGSTSKAAGGVRAQFSDPVNIELGARSLAAFENFAVRPGAEIDLRRHGYLFLLDDDADLDAFTESVRLQNSRGVPSRIIDVDEAARLCPIVARDGLVGGAYSPTDGHCTPEAVAQGYAAGARRNGAAIVQHCTVSDVLVEGGAVAGVVTDRGTVHAPAVLCAAGAWSAAVGAMAGVELPVVPKRRQVIVTEPMPELPPNLPMTIDFGATFYFHPEGDGLLIGLSDPDESTGFHLERTERWMDLVAEAIAYRTPSLQSVGIRTGWAGLYEETPDQNALIGTAGDVPGFYYATGFSGHGFLQSPAVGEVMRDLYLGRRPAIDVSGLAVSRFAGTGARPEKNCV
ncbi:NAD(P)/FAD-dependent oxidoreductase [Spelaeicoccus albus]|uniref:Sarcosine oxidase subunit beta n=1 Tax=Spelaeicoccus albus TaxID=1280376 RepID=A0A7Z0D2J2_9MICO|nr:FAD-binding oxidoreductase [Spelaeicoccus albus]NYI67692.1 sarcosine oxidase subunit beta [Spelaeicoccus albus]